MVRAWQLGDKDLAIEIINNVSTPLKINLTDNQYGKDINYVVWTVINRAKSEFKINFNQNEESLKTVAERIYHLLPLFKKFHQSTFFKEGSIKINLGDYAEADGLAFCSNRDGQILIPDDGFVRTKGYEETRVFYKENIVPWEEKNQLSFGVAHQLGFLRQVYGKIFKGSSSVKLSKDQLIGKFLTLG